ncbi:MAG: DUF2461 domain-containing protein [Bacteroidales bacterium]|nr:DUF2461 domain-containing protein [Bacteroidales bacterium]MDZ4203854.1 DUF2461 domain-containing protein [Bacteroidales bacterium]
MDTKETLRFLSELSLNNNREWFHENKKTYEVIKADILGFVGNLIVQISAFDPDIIAINPKDCLFRIYRDVRFSNDKSPYKTHIGAFISKGGRKGNHSGYYIHFEPGQSLVAGGLYMPTPPVLKAVRDEIHFNTDEFQEIINHPEFKKFFAGLDDDDKLTRPPKGYPADWEHIDLLKYRSYTVSASLPEKLLSEHSFNDYLLSAFHTMYPFNRFLKRALVNMGG